jgi:hypothetical protein
MMRSNADLTIYNKYVGLDRIEVYQRTQIKAVTWENRKGSNVLRTGGQNAADQARVFIPLLRPNYLGPVAWQNLPVKTGKWTLQIGDFIVRGLIPDDLTAAFAASDLQSKYDDVLVISSVDRMDEGSLVMQHWMVGAK